MKDFIIHKIAMTIALVSLKSEFIISNKFFLLKLNIAKQNSFFRKIKMDY